MKPEVRDAINNTKQIYTRTKIYDISSNFKNGRKCCR